jgi:hypothetical protein
MRLTPEERRRLAERAADPEGYERREREAEDARLESRRLWAASALTGDLDVCRSICEGHPVLARQLDATALRRALRGGAFPPPNNYVRVTGEMLDAVAEGGPFEPKGRKR